MVAVLSGLTLTTQAQIIWSTGAFASDPVGPYGSTTSFGDTSTPTLSIVDPGMAGPGSHAMRLMWNQDGSFINFQSAGHSYPAAGNTSANLADYNFDFDLKVTGIDAGPYPQGFQISIFGPGGGVFSGPKVELDLTSTVFPAGQGYQHYSFNLGTFTPRTFDPTAASFTAGFGIVSFGGPNTPVVGETFDFANLRITMVPEPSSFALFTGAFGLLAGWRRYRRKS